MWRWIIVNGITGFLWTERKKEVTFWVMAWCYNLSPASAGHSSTSPFEHITIQAHHSNTSPFEHITLRIPVRAFWRRHGNFKVALWKTKAVTIYSWFFPYYSNRSSISLRTVLTEIHTISSCHKFHILQCPTIRCKK